jgi:hypothetical protein
MLGAVANATLLRQLVDAGQAHTRLPAVEEQEALDLLRQFELNDLLTLAPAAVRNHGKNIGDRAIGYETSAPRTFTARRNPAGIEGCCAGIPARCEPPVRIIGPGRLRMPRSGRCAARKA